MRQAQRSSSAMAAKYTGWVTALGRRADENEVKRTALRAGLLVTTNLPFDEWTAVFGSKRLTGALLDRLTHHVHILEMNGDSRPWATGPQRRCSTGMGMPRRRNRRHGKVHRNKCWYHRQEQQDSRLIPPRSCPTDRVHLNTPRHEAYRFGPATPVTPLCTARFRV